MIAVLKNNFNILKFLTIIATGTLLVFLPVAGDPADLVIQNKTVTGKQVYDSAGGIVFDQVIIESSADITAIAGGRILIKPGTRIKSGARFKTLKDDGDGMSNLCELTYFGNLDHLPDDDDDLDGLTNNVECQNGTSPNDPDTDDDGTSDACESIYDTTSPVITLLGRNPLYLCFNDHYTDPGATAWDDCLGDITSAVIITNPVDTGASGKYRVRYNVQDGAGNAAAEKIRTVYVDIVSPVITLKGENPIKLCRSEVFNDPGASASDNCSGNLTDSIVATHSVNTDVSGTYPVVYTVTDTAGNQAIPVERSVIVDADLPVINLKGEAPMFLCLGDSYVEAGASASDDTDGDITDDIVIHGSVNTGRTGTYEVTYNVTDTCGNSAEPQTRLVTVLNSTDTIRIETSYTYDSVGRIRTIVIQTTE